MKKTKRLLSLLLAAMLVAGCTVGCSSSSSSSSTSSSGSSTTSTDDGEEEKVYEDITYTFMSHNAISEYPDDGGEAYDVILAAWEEDLGITNTDFNIIMATGDDYTTKVTTLLADNTPPDVFRCALDDLATYVNSGIVVAVDELVEQMPAYQELLETVPGNQERYDAYMINGVHYGLPQLFLEGELNGPNTSGLVLRTDWLDNLGLESPTTVEDLHDVLYAFTYDDPDGDGVDNTYGYGGDSDSQFKAIFGSFGIYMNGINSWSEVDGEIVHNSTLPEVQEALEILSEWYAEGIIDPDKFIIESTQSKDKFIAGYFGVWEASVWWASDARTAWETTDPGAWCETILPVEGESGDAGFPVTLSTDDTMVISTNAYENKDIDRLIAILDWSVDVDGGQMLLGYGVEGEHYEYDEETNVITEYISASEKYAIGYSNPVKFISTIDRRWIPDGDPQQTDLMTANDSDYWLYTEFEGSVQAMSDYPDLNDLWLEYMTKIIIGSLSIDAWDDYVEEFYSSGGTELTEQVNEAVYG